MEQLSLFEPLDRTGRQKEGLREWIKHGCKGTLSWATGVGKTNAGLMAIQLLVSKNPNLRVLIVVPTETLQNQWQYKIDMKGLSYNCNVLVINTAIKEKRECDFLIIDEIHRCGSDNFRKVFTFNYKYILGLTATLERLDGKHELITKYCPEVDKITTSEAIANGWLAQNVEYKVVLDVEDIDIYKRMTAEFNEHFEFFRYDFNIAMSMLGKDGYIKRSAYRDELCKMNKSLDPKETFKLVTYHATALARVLQARKKFINEHPKKLELTREIIKHRPNSKIITFSATIDIAEKIGIGKVYSTKGGKKKNKMTLEEFTAAPQAILNTSKKADEGLDVPGLNVAIILGQDSSPTRFTQRIGRVIRAEGDKVAEIFTFVINDTVEMNWWTSSHKNSDDKTISIDEKNLMKVLKGEDYDTYKRPSAKFTFRF
jgi:superfamily II DNA or RNA helicase